MNILQQQRCGHGRATTILSGALDLQITQAKKEQKSARLRAAAARTAIAETLGRNGVQVLPQRTCCLRYLLHAQAFRIIRTCVLQTTGTCSISARLDVILKILELAVISSSSMRPGQRGQVWGVCGCIMACCDVLACPHSAVML